MTQEVRTRTRSRAVDAAPDARPEPPAPTRPGQGSAVGYVYTKRTCYGRGEENLEEISVPVFHSAPARVRVGGSITQNLGDFNSARVEVSVEMPCLPESSEVDRVYQSLSQKVDFLCRRELAIATGQEIPQQ